MRWAGAMALMMIGAAQAAEVETALVLVLDASDSMTAQELRFARAAHAEALASLEVQRAIRETESGRIAVAYVEFAVGARTVVDWTILDGNVLSAIIVGSTIIDADREGLGTTTAIAAGLLEADRLFDTLPFTAERLVVDIAGDGKSNTGAPVSLGREALLSRGVTINGMPMVGASAERDFAGYYEAEIIGGPGAFSIPLEQFTDMAEVLRQKIVQEAF